MREARTKTIGATKYTVNQLPPSLALDLLQDLIKVLGPALAPIVSNIGQLGSLLEKDTDGLTLNFLGDAVRVLCAGVDKAITKSTIATLANVTVIEGKGKLSTVYEAHFAEAGLMELIQWLGFALETQYDDFLGVLGSAIKSASRPGITAPKA